MGRWTTGATTTRACNRLELSYYTKKGYIYKGAYHIIPISWENSRGRSTGDILTYVDYTGERPFLRLVYTQTNNRTGEKNKMDYKVFLESLPSNLGKGEVWYFLCPVSGIRCRVLYSAYSSLYFKARNAYNNRIYYSSQLSSKMDYANDRYWTIKRRLEKLEGEKYFKWNYQGQPTKKAKLWAKLWQELERWDLERWQPHNMPSVIRKSIEDVPRKWR